MPKAETYIWGERRRLIGNEEYIRRRCHKTSYGHCILRIGDCQGPVVLLPVTLSSAKTLCYE